MPEPAHNSGPHLPDCILASIATLALLACTSNAGAGVFAEGDSIMLQAGPYVYHRNDEPHHNNAPLLFGVEWESASRWEAGASYFENSFYQHCIYDYLGKRWFLRQTDDGLYLKLTGGPLYGYKDEHEDKVPLNYNGLGLAILPAVGYQHGRANVQLVTLGTAMERVRISLVCICCAKDNRDASGGRQRDSRFLRWTITHSTLP